MQTTWTKIVLKIASPGLKICPKCVGGRGSAPDPAGGAYSTPPNPLAAIRGPTSKGRKGEGKGRGGSRHTNPQLLPAPMQVGGTGSKLRMLLLRQTCPENCQKPSRGLSGSITELKSKFLVQLHLLKPHMFRMTHQMSAIRTKRSELTVNELLLHIDFSENWTTKNPSEVQSAHFGS